MSMAAAKRTTGAEEWWQKTLLEKDECDHSQNSTRRSITPPCQNLGPVKDDRRTLWVRQYAGASDVNNLSTQCLVLADCEQVFEDLDSWASWNRPALSRLKAALQQGDCVKVAAVSGGDKVGRVGGGLLSMGDLIVYRPPLFIGL